MLGEVLSGLRTGLCGEKVRDLMVDKNGVEIRTGDVVRVSGAFFQSDNGTYYVEHSPGDPTWLGSDYSLRRICRNGRLSAGKGKIAFWPLGAFTNDRFKNAQARAWNAKNAEIEVIPFEKTDEIRKHFEEEAKKTGDAIRYYVDYCGWSEESDSIRRYKACKAHCEAVAARLAA